MPFSFNQVNVCANLKTAVNLLPDKTKCAAKRSGAASGARAWWAQLSVKNLLADTTNAKYSWHDNRKGTWKFRQMLPNCQSYNLRFANGRQACQTNQYHSMHMKALAKHHLTEILVRSQQQCCLLIRQVQDSIIGHPWPQLSNVQNLIPLLPQTLNNGAVNTFVSQKVHAGASAKG